MIKRFLFTILLFLVNTLVLNAQVVNNVSPDRSNIYFHALDSMVRILQKADAFDKITVYGNNFIIQSFPDEVVGMDLIKMDSNRKKTPRIKKGEARLVIRPLEIIRDQFKVRILTWGDDGFIGDGLYVFLYKYVSATMTFNLVDIKSGVEL